MRRVTLVATGAAAEDAAIRLEELAEASVRRVAALDEVPWSETDVVWVHGIVASGPEAHWGIDALANWLRSGGRLLATSEATALPLALGLETFPPRAIELSGGVRLIGFAPHPLFAGPHLSADVSRVGPPGVEERWYGYSGSLADGWPVGGVVARALRAGVADGPVLAWEYAVGAGGVLCLGAPVLLADALLGDGVPHESRGATPICWPHPGGVARRDAAAPLPRIGELGGEWSPSPSTLARVEERSGPWVVAGRRLAAAGGERGGLASVWAYPYRIAADVALHFGAVPAPAAPMREGADELERRHRVGRFDVVERWSTALELPVLVWDVEADGGVPLGFEWRVDLRRLPPYPAGAAGGLRFNVSESGRRLRVVADGGAQAVFRLTGAPIIAAEGEGDSVRIRAEGRGSARIVMVGARDEADLDRTLAAIERKGLAGFRSQRAQHARLLHEHGTTLECPDDALVAAIEWAKVRTDAALVELLDGGRGPVLGLERALEAAPAIALRLDDAIAVALGQLAAGQREGPRELLKLLTRLRDRHGRVPSTVVPDGPVLFDDGAAALRLRELASRLLAWTADWPLLERLGVVGVTEGLPAGAPELGASRELPSDAVAGARLIRAVVEGMWGVVPDAGAGAVRIAPALPATWDRMGLRRLRVGGTVLDVHLRRRFDRLVAQVQRRHGPPIEVTFAPRPAAGTPPLSITVDDVELGGARARFVADGEHQVLFQY